MVTQQNAAASEEMATSSEELSNQADQLNELISFFKVGDKFDFNVKKTITKTPKNGKSVNTKQVLTTYNTKGVDLELSKADNLDVEYEQF